MKNVNHLVFCFEYDAVADAISDRLIKGGFWGEHGFEAMLKIKGPIMSQINMFLNESFLILI